MAEKPKDKPPVEEGAATNEPKKIHVRLNDQAADGGFVDDETKFHLSRREVAELSVNVGKKTASLLTKGVIIKCKPDGKPLKSADED